MRTAPPGKDSETVLIGALVRPRDDRLPLAHRERHESGYGGEVD